MINIIFATDINLLIGNNNELPWHYKKDLLFLKEKTNNKIVLMGDNTYKSLRFYYKDKKLPYNKIYLATKNSDNSYFFKEDDITVVNDIFGFIKNNKEEIWVIGGKTIYELLLPYADNLYITFILKSHKGNIYLNKLDLSNFEIVDKKIEDFLVFCHYERKIK